MAAKAHLVIDQGADFETTIEITDDDGNAMALTDYTARSQIRKHYSSSNAVAFTVTVDEGSGEVVLSLSANATIDMMPGRYLYDVELVSPANTVTRAVEGIVTITPNMTR